jgi:hypothetical protein
MDGLWGSVSKYVNVVSKKTGELWDNVANVVAPLPDDGTDRSGSHGTMGTPAAREVCCFSIMIIL